MKRLPLVAVAIVLMISAYAAAQTDPGDAAIDWLSIPDFTVEAALGTAVDDAGKLTGEATRFASDVGTIFCRVQAIGLEPKETAELTVTWFREDRDRCTARLTLTKAKPRDVAQCNIPAAQAGSWRVEVENADGELLAVEPFVVGQPSLVEEDRRKTTNEK